MTSNQQPRSPTECLTLVVEVDKFSVHFDHDEPCVCRLQEVQHDTLVRLYNTGMAHGENTQHQLLHRSAVNTIKSQTGLKRTTPEGTLKVVGRHTFFEMNCVVLPLVQIKILHEHVELQCKHRCFNSDNNFKCSEQTLRCCLTHFFDTQVTNCARHCGRKPHDCTSRGIVVMLLLPHSELNSTAWTQSVLVKENRTGNTRKT